MRYTQPDACLYDGSARRLRSWHAPALPEEPPPGSQARAAQISLRARPSNAGAVGAIKGGWLRRLAPSLALASTERNISFAGARRPARSQPGSLAEAGSA